MERAYPHKIVPEDEIPEHLKERYMALSEDDAMLLKEKTPEQRAAWLAERSKDHIGRGGRL